MSVVKMLRRIGYTLIALVALANGVRVYGVTRYFDVNGTTAGSGVVTGTTYDWDGLFWNNNDATGTTAPTTWDPQSATGDFAKFSAGADANGKTYTVNLNANHTSNGAQSATNSGGTVKITTAPGIELKVAAAPQGYFAGTNATLEFDGTVGAFDNTSQFVWQGGGGSLNLYGTFNSSEFSQPIQLNSGNGVNFNSANSFGTLGITYSGTLTTAVLANPTVGNFTIANAVTMPTGKNSTMIYTGTAPVTFTNWDLGGGSAFISTLNIANNSFRTARMIIDGLKGSSNLVVGSPSGDTQPDNGTLQLTGTSTYSGLTFLGLVNGTNGGTAAAPSTGTPALEATDGTGLPSGSALYLNGGVFQTSSGTFTRSMGSSGVQWYWPFTGAALTIGNQTAAGGGGFAAVTNPLTVNINGNATPDQLQWGDAFTDAGTKILGPLKFGSGTSNAKTTWVNPIDMNSSGSPVTRTILVTAGAGGDSAEMTGVLSNSSGDAGLTKTGKGTLTLNQANTYTGPTTISATAFGTTGTINGGILATSLLANGGTASGIGQSSNAAANLVFLGSTAGTASGSTAVATLQYTGPVASTDRLFTLGTGTSAGTIDASGSGPLTFSNTGAMAFAPTLLGARTLTLSGTNTGNNTMTPVIGDDPAAGSGATSLTKSGAGTWVLPSANTYTGTTAANAGVLILANANAMPSANAVSLGGGTLRNSTGGLVTVGGNTSLTTNSTIDGANGFTFNGAFTNTAAAARTLTNNSTGPVTLAGPVNLSNSATARVVTIAGTGNTSITGIIANGSTSTTSGLTKSGASTLTLTNANTYGGVTTISTGSTLLANNSSGSATGTGAVTVSAGGTLGGTGTIGGAITNNGTLSPGSGGVGTLSTSSNFLDGVSSIWNIDLSGATADKLAVTGNIDLTAADTLNVLGSGTGTSWIIGTYTGTETGAFDTITAGYNVTYTGGNITLNVASACAPGDLNCDGHEDAGDYVFWRKNNSTPPGDYAVWVANFGTPPGAGSGGGLGANGGAVPEPSSVALLMLGLVAMAARRRGR